MTRNKFKIIWESIFIISLLISINAYANEIENRKLLFHNEDYKIYLFTDHFNIKVVDKNDKGVFEFNDVISFNTDITLKVETVLEIDYLDKDEVELNIRLSNNQLLRTHIKFDSTISLISLKTNKIKLNVSSIFGSNRLYDVEEIYGFGETWNGSVAQRGKQVEILDKNGTPDECAYMPYYVSTKNYAFWFNYGGRVKFDVGQLNSTKLTWELFDNKLEFNLLLSNSVENTVKAFSKYVGLPSKPPRWAFKPWAWLMHDPEQPGAHISTLSGEHAVQMVEKFKKMDIPVGVTWMEPPWQTARTSFIPNQEFDADIKNTISKLNLMGVKTLAWTVPYTTSDSPNWQEAVKNNYIVSKPNELQSDGKIIITRSGEVEGKSYNYIDFTNPDAVKWWQSEIEKAIDLGFSGFKLDAGQSLENDAVLFEQKVGKDWHNSYAHYYNKTFHEILSEKLDDDFLMIPRAAFIGTGQYTNFKWPGDLSASFGKNGLPSSLYSTLSASLSGLSFLSTDIGGFEGRPAPEKVWIRWAQFGSMLPGMETLHMPWWYSEKAKEHYKYLSWLHTNLIPYWNSLAHLSANEGTPICRPLIWDYQDDVNTWRINDQFTVGEYLLVAPIIEQNSSRNVYLPKGEWFDFWDDSIKYDGNKNYKWFKGWEESKWKFPSYVKAGSIIPLEITNDITGFGWNEFSEYTTLAIWPQENGNSSFILHDKEDEVEISLSSKDDIYSINWSNSKLDYILRIHPTNKKVPTEVNRNSKKVSNINSLGDFLNKMNDCWYYDVDSDKIFIKVFNSVNPTEIKVRFDK